MVPRDSGRPGQEEAAYLALASALYMQNRQSYRQEVRREDPNNLQGAPAIRRNYYKGRDLSLFV